MAEYRILLRGVPLLNKNDRIGWRRRAVAVRAIRTAAGWQARDARAPIPRLDRVEITGVYHPTVARVRDAENWSDTRKPAIDGLVDAGVLANDDESHVVRTHDEIGAIDPYGPSYELIIREVP